MMCQTDVYHYNGRRVYIARWEAGPGTADSRITWSDGYVEETIGHGGRTPRELYLRDRNRLEPQEISLYASPTPDIEFDWPEPSGFKVNAVGVPWRGDRRPVHAPRVTQRPEFHARSNPGGR